MNTAAITIFSSAMRSAQPLACRLFEAALAHGKVANAYLLVGRAAEDKVSLAREMACFLNCQSPTSKTSGACIATAAPPDEYCLNCQWISRGEHPQAWLPLTGEGKSQRIPVEKVRNLTEELGKTSSYVRVVVVPASDEYTFHRPAANALLKSIEEPPPGCLFFFFADSPEDVLATIVSRCQVIPVARPLTLGLWKGDQSTSDLPPEGLAKLDAARSAFIMNVRRCFQSTHTVSSPLKAATDGLELTKQLQEICKELVALQDDEIRVSQQLLDVVAASELEVLREVASTDSACAEYLGKVLALSEKTKRQINQYVKPANALETFAFALNELRHQYSGEISLAKR